MPAIDAGGAPHVFHMFFFGLFCMPFFQLRSVSLSIHMFPISPHGSKQDSSHHPINLSHQPWVPCAGFYQHASVLPALVGSYMCVAPISHGPHHSYEPCWPPRIGTPNCAQQSLAFVQPPDLKFLMTWLLFCGRSLLIKFNSSKRRQDVLGCSH